MDWLKATAVEQGQAMMAGVLDPVDQTEAYLAAAAAHPYGTRIYARMTPERARAEAIASHDRARAGLRRGLLDGVALSWKDNIDSAGVATEAGSRLLAGRVPDRDAAALAAATASGLVCLGKTHMTELAFSGLGVNPSTATPPNAYDPDLAPGGSSSGAAVSVALGLAAAAIGSDTGGSIRLPAVWNGVTGFKPTPGALLAEGVVPLCRRFDAIGPIGRNVADCAAIFALLAGQKAPDLDGLGIGDLRLLVLEGLPFDEIREAPAAAFEMAIDTLGRAGARISRAAPDCVREAAALTPVLFTPEAYGLWKAQIEIAPDVMYPPILTRFRAGRDVSAADYVAGWDQLNRLRLRWAEAVAGYDAVLLPTSAILPPDAAKLAGDEAFFAAENILALRNTRIGNLLGLPGISLPTQQPACGLMAMGAVGDDRRLLVVADALEAALA
ncbi:amidase [Paracoccus suum]|uniref:Amidase n=1 Tax=Paracoccus suum TaxID=2259340 RepID=A0A344PHH6_9RHOB|nr:amidase family protein [Paracoccus suum]AXC48831.1 amidase [Paracoccus suum]